MIETFRAIYANSICEIKSSGRYTLSETKKDSNMRHLLTSLIHQKLGIQNFPGAPQEDGMMYCSIMFLSSMTEYGMASL